jgi:6-pyruvoyltetrahydropterin/6-carboxytetrahydropterin synthase
MIRFFELSFSSAHFYAQPKWSEEKNREIFGAGYNQPGHGHNYRLVAGFEWTEKADVNAIEKKLKEIITPLDHHHLNAEVPEFKNLVPTTENIANYLSKKINTSISSAKLKKLSLYETDDLWAEVDCE